MGSLGGGENTPDRASAKALGQEGVGCIEDKEGGASVA